MDSQRSSLHKARALDTRQEGTRCGLIPGRLYWEPDALAHARLPPSLSDPRGKGGWSG